MSPHQIPTDHSPLARHPQRPWRPVETSPRRPVRAVAHTYAAAVVRELPRRGDRRDEPAGTW
jgi:hypothetical protein